MSVDESVESEGDEVGGDVVWHVVSCDVYPWGVCMC